MLRCFFTLSHFALAATILSACLLFPSSGITAALAAVQSDRDHADTNFTKL